MANIIKNLFGGNKKSSSTIIIIIIIIIIVLLLSSSAAAYMMTINKTGSQQEQEQEQEQEQQVNPSGTRVNASGSTVNASGTRVNASGSTVNASGSTVNASGTRVNVSGSTVNASGSTVNASGSTVNASGSTVNASGTTVNASGTTVNASGTTVNASGSTAPVMAQASTAPVMAQASTAPRLPYTIESKTTQYGANFDKISNQICTNTTTAPSGLTLDEILNKCATTEQKLGGRGQCMGIVQNTDGTYQACLTIGTDPSNNNTTTWKKTSNATLPYTYASKTTANGAKYDIISNQICSSTTGAPGALTLDEVLNKCALEQNLGNLGSPCAGIIENNDGTFSGCLNISENTTNDNTTNWKKTSNATSTTAYNPSFISPPSSYVPTTTKTTDNGANFSSYSNIKCYSTTGAPAGLTLDDILNKCASTTNLGGLSKPCIGIQQNADGTYSGCLDVYRNPSNDGKVHWIKTSDPTRTTTSLVKSVVTLPSTATILETKTTANGAQFKRSSDVQCYSTTSAPTGSTLDEILNNCATTTKLGGISPCLGVQQRADGSFSGCIDVYNSPAYYGNVSWLKVSEPTIQ